MIVRALLAALLVVAAGGASSAPPELRSTHEAATVLYDAPSTRSRKLFVVGPGYPVEVMVALEGWVKVRDASGDLAWIEARALSNRRTVLVRARQAEVRESPDDAAPIVFRAAQHVWLDLVEPPNAGWARVRHADGSTGFVRSQQIWGG